MAYREEIIKTFEQDVFPFIGKRPIGEVKPLELLEVLRRIEKRGALEKTRKVRQRSGSIITKNTTKIVILAVVRTQEMRFSTWEEVDLEKGVWEIPAEQDSVVISAITPAKEK